VPVGLFALVNYYRAFKLYRKSKFTAKESFTRSYFKDGWFGWDLFFAAIVLAALPMIIYFWQHSADFSGRGNQISVMASAQPIKEFAISAVKTLGQFVVIGDHNARHNIPGSPQIFWPLIPLFVIGLGYSIGQIFKSGNWRQKDFNSLQVHFTLLFWWGAMLAPSILTTEGIPHSLRSIGSIPPSYIFVGLGGYLILRLIQTMIKKPAPLKMLTILLFLGLASLVGVEFWRYFVAWGQNPETRGAFNQNYVDEASYINSLPGEVRKYIFVNEGGVPVPYPDGIPMSTQTIMFLTRKTPNIRYMTPADCKDCSAIVAPAIFLPLRYDQNLFDDFQKYFPNGQIEKINDFSVFKINF
jgi:hypothetical protein